MSLEIIKSQLPHLLNLDNFNSGNFNSGLNHIYDNPQLSFEIIISGCMIFFNYLLLSLIWRLLPVSRVRSLYISTFHSLIVATYAIYRLVDYYRQRNCEGLNMNGESYLCLSSLLAIENSSVYLCLSTFIEIFKRLFTIFSSTVHYVVPQTRDLIHIYILTLTASYSFFDLEKLSEVGELWKSSASILFHHVGMFFVMVINIGLFLSGTHEYEYLLYLGFLSELSTPLLNYLKICHHRGDTAPVFLYRIFILIYFFCRPVVLSYVIYEINKKIEEGSDFPISLNLALGSTIFFLLLNLVWFYLIIKKFIRSKHEK